MEQAVREHPMTKARKQAGVSMRDVALATGCDKSNISRIENGKYLPSTDLANRLAAYFGNTVTRDELLYPQDYVEGAKKPVRSAAQAEG